MAHTVFCRKYQQEMEGLDAPPFPGPQGEEIYENVSRQAWEEWQRHQTMLINEHHLNLMERETKRYLTEQRERFLRNEPFEQPQGYVPPSE